MLSSAWQVWNSTMGKSRRKALAQAINRLSDALENPEDGDLPDAAEQAREELVNELKTDDEKYVKNYTVGARARVKMSRGEGPRDSDEWVLEGEGETAEEAQQEFDEMLDKYIDEWADATREIDPYE